MEGRAGFSALFHPVGGGHREGRSGGLGVGDLPLWFRDRSETRELASLRGGLRVEGRAPEPIIRSGRPVGGASTATLSCPELPGPGTCGRVACCCQAVFPGSPPPPSPPLPSSALWGRMDRAGKAHMGGRTRDWLVWEELDWGEG